MNGILESIAQHPFAALGVAAWSLFLVSLVLQSITECVALKVTRQRPPVPSIPLPGTSLHRSLPEIDADEQDGPREPFRRERLGEASPFLARPGAA